MAYTIEQLQTAHSRARTPEEKDHIQVLINQTVPEQTVENNLPSQGEALIRGAGQGASFGFLDELFGGMNLQVRGQAGLYEQGETPQQVYQQARDSQRTANQQSQMAHPGTYITGEILGGAAVPGLGAAKAAQTGATAVKGLGATGRMSLTGAGAGGVYGAGVSEADTAGGIALDTAKGVGLGAVGGVVGAGIGKLLVLGGRSAGDLVKLIFASTPKNVAEKMLGVQLRSMGFDTVEAVQAELSRLGPQATLADLVPDLAEKVAQSGKPAAKIVKSALYERDRGMAGRVAESASKTLKPIVSDGYHKFLDTITGIKKNLAGPMYERAMNYSLKPTEYMKSFGKTPGSSKHKLWEEALDRVDTKRAGGDKISNANVYHELQKVIRGKAEAASRSGDKDLSRALTLMRKQLVKELDEMLPEYKQARMIYGGSIRVEEAGEFGRDLIKNNKIMAEDYNKLTRGYSDSESEAMRVGLMRGVMDVLEGARDTADVTVKLSQTPRIRQILRQAFRKEEDAEDFLRAAGIEQELRRTFTQVTGNSRTAARLAMAAEGKGGSDAAQAVGASPLGTAVNAVRDTLSKMVNTLSNEELDATARIIMQQMPDATVKRVMRKLKSEVLSELSGDSKISGAITGAALPVPIDTVTE
jgi:hypothetical protein